MFDKEFRVVALQPFGYDRRESIHKNLEGMQWEYDYEYHVGKYSYHKLLQKNVGFELDMIYESKSWEMMMDLDPEPNSCFWVIGNSNNIRS